MNQKQNKTLTQNYSYYLKYPRKKNFKSYM